MQNTKDLHFKMNIKNLNHKLEFKLDLEDFDNNFVPIPLGIPYIKQLMQHMKEIYPNVKMLPFMHFPEDRNIIGRALLLDIDKQPELFFICERQLPQAPLAHEKYDVYFSKKYFDEITEHILNHQRKNIGKAN